LNKGLGGPNDMRNLTPITKKANSRHFHEVEKIAKQLITKGYVIHYKVKATYDAGPSFGDKTIAKEHLAKFPSQLECKLSVLNEIANEKPPAELVVTVKNEM